MQSMHLEISLNAIISAGGFKPNSSLRSIQLIRGNQFIAEADLYSLLIDGKVPRIGP